jgi:primosomal protein N' (replication factor Y)
VDLAVMHLDRDFDYLVPEEWQDRAVPGARVRVRFSGRLRDAYVLARIAQADVDRPRPIERVIDEVPPLTDDTLELVQKTAERYVGTFWDVARAAVPARHARAERAVLASPEPDGDPVFDPVVEFAVEPAPPPNPQVWGPYTWPEVVTDPRRMVWASAPGTDPSREIADLVVAYRDRGRGVVVVVPDAADVSRVRLAFSGVVPDTDIAELSANAGPERRYREFLRVRTGRARVVVGTRAAVFAPVARIGLIVVWDDGDDVFREPHAPYWDVREVAALRSHISGCDLFVGAPARSVATQWWCDSGWAQSIEPRRPEWWNVRAIDDREVARDPGAATARIPTAAWEVARAGLSEGPVLVQVMRRGYVPGLACRECRLPAQCVDDDCRGPLEVASGHAIPRCARCGTLAGSWSCPSCGSQHVRAMSVGAGRTAEELGRAFPGVPVVWSEADRMVRNVAGKPALVIATPGAEPQADGGYSALVLLDARAATSTLAAREQLVRRWFGAARLVRAGAQVCVVADPGMPEVQALMRWDSRWFAQRELDERRSIGLPPLTRVAELTGPPDAVVSVDRSIAVGHRTLGPVDVASGTRSYLVVPRAHAQALTRQLADALRSASVGESAVREVRVRMDPRDM